MAIIEVAISGTIGKQVVPTNGKSLLRNVVLTPNTSAALVRIRDGNASGTVVLIMRGIINSTQSSGPVSHYFTKGMHVTVLGGTATAYLDIS